MWIEVLSDKLANYLMEKMDFGRIEYLKIKLGIEVALINMLKGIIVYSLAILMDILILTLITHAAYLVVRRVAYGLHANSSINCTLISIFSFVFLPYQLKNITINNGLVFFLFLVSFFLLYLYAPADTEKNPLIGLERRTKLRNKSLVRVIILMFITLVIPSSLIKIMITLGVLMQIISILPLTYKLLGRSYNNYEKEEI